MSKRTKVIKVEPLQGYELAKFIHSRGGKELSLKMTARRRKSKIPAGPGKA